ncbi:MAG: hypothetical protein VKL42_22420 [Snowella sp.]|nr:hypothetical protein [Snowella sp.]
MSEWRNFLIYLPLDKANWEFKSASNIVAPMLLYYSGILQATPQFYHLLLVTQLTAPVGLPPRSQSVPTPDLLHPKATHDFSLIYQSRQEASGREFLFRFQMDGTDVTAKQLTYLLVEVLQNTTSAEKHYLLDRKYGQFWSGLAANKLYQLKTKHETWVDTRSLKIG